MHLNLNGIVFPILQAIARASVSERGLEWCIDIGMDEVEFLDTYASPRFYASGLRFEGSRWSDLDSQSIMMEAPFDNRLGPDSRCYFWEHSPIPQSKLTFLRRVGHDYIIRWDGYCDPHWDEPFDVQVPFLIEARLIFQSLHIKFDEYSESEKIVAWLSESLDLKGLL